MALNKQRVPIQIQGILTNVDEKQGPTGSLVNSQNVIYDKIGRIDRRPAYKSISNFLSQNRYDNNTFLNTNYVNNNSYLINERITKYKNEVLSLVRSYGFKNDLHNEKGLISPAEELNFDMEVNDIPSNATFNKDEYQKNYNEQYQNTVYSPRTGITAILCVESRTGFFTIRFIKDGKQIFSYTDYNPSNPLPNNDPWEFNRNTKIIFVETAVGPACVYSYYDDNNSNIVIRTIDISEITGTNNYNFSVNQLITVPTGTSPNNGVFDLEQISSQRIVLAGYLNGAFRVYIYSLSYTINSSLIMTSTLTKVSDYDVPNNDAKFAVTIKPIDYGLSDGNYFLLLYNGNAADTSSPLIPTIAEMWGVVLKVDPLFAVTTYKARTKLFTFPMSTYVITTNGTTAATYYENKYIINFGVSDYVNNPKNSTTKDCKIYVSCATAETNAAVAYYDYFSKDFRFKGKNNSLFKFSYNPVAHTVTLEDEFKGLTLASKPVTLNYNDYYVTQNVDYLQNSYYLYASDRRSIKNTFSVAQFFYQNSGTISPYIFNQGYASYFKAGFSSLFANKNINCGWIGNLNLIDSVPTDFTNISSYEKDVRFVFGAAYRNDFVNNNIQKLTVNPTSTFGDDYFSPEDLSNYTDCCSSKILKLNINSKYRFSSIDLDGNKYFTGGQVNSFDGNKIYKVGFNQYPTFRNSNYLFNLSVSPEISFPVTSVTTTTNIVTVPNDFTTGRKPLTNGEKVRFILASGTLPAGLVEDTTYTIFGQKVSKEYFISSLTAGANYTFKLVDDTGATIVFSTTASPANFNLLRYPYVYFENKNYSFVAVYEFLDSNGKLIRSAPSPIAVNINLKNTFNGSTAKANLISEMAFQVSNYAFKDKFVTKSSENIKNNVSVSLYRTIGDSANGVYYFCGSSPCDLTSNYIIVKTNKLNDADLIRGKVLYTTGQELESIPAPSSLATVIKDNRLWSLSSENRNEIWYSKEVIKNEGVEFNDSLVKKIDNFDGGIVNIVSMDDKIIVFKENSIYYFSGNGANNIGQSENFSDTIKISGSIGLDKNNPLALLLTDYGIVFKSTKGIYLLDRGLSAPVYIGAGIENYIRGKNVSKMANVFDRNEIKVLSEGNVFTFNIEQKLWYVEKMSKLAIDLYSDASGIYATNLPTGILQDVTLTQFNTNSVVKQEYINGLKDFDRYFPQTVTGFIIPVETIDYYNSLIETSWINLTGIQNFGRVTRCFILGNINKDISVSSGVNFKVSFRYDYENGFFEEKTFNNVNFDSMGNFEIECHLGRQKCQSIGIKIETVGTSSIINNDISISSVLFEVGYKQKLPVPAKRIK